MITTRQLALFATLMLCLPALGQQVDLRGPTREAGTGYLMLNQTQTDQGTMDMSIQGQVLQGKMETDTDQRIRYEFLEVADGQVNQVRMTTERMRTVSKTEMMGQVQEQNQGAEMEGMILTTTRTEDGWQTQVDGGALPQQAAQMISEMGFYDVRDLYPAEPVAPGGTWEITGEQLSAMMSIAGMPGSTADGTSKFTLAEVKDIDGVPTAIINYDLDFTVTMVMEQPGMTMNITTDMIGKGTIHRRLDTYLESNTMEGSMVITMNTMQGEQMAMQMDAEMPVRVSTRMLPLDAVIDDAE